MKNMILLLHVDASLNTGGLVGSQGGYICGVTDQSLPDGKSAPWSPLAWRSFPAPPSALSCSVHLSGSQVVSCLVNEPTRRHWRF